MNLLTNKKMSLARGSFSGKKRGGAVAILLILLVGCAVIFGAYYASTLKGSRERLDDYFTDQIDGEKAMAYLKESEELESRFNSIHSVKKDKITNEDIAIYEKAITSYEKYLTYSGIDKRVNPRADKMRRRLHDFRATKTRERSVVLEQEADKLAGQKKYAEAEKKYREAYELEETIETKYSLSDKRNSGRTMSLKNRMQTMQAIPLRERAERLEKEGTAALEKRDWTTANLRLREALKIQQQLWADYRIAVLTGTQSIVRLNELVETVASAPYMERREAAEKEAAQFEENLDWESAKTAWEKALTEFDLIEKNFPRSKYADKEIGARLRQNRANAEAAPSFFELKETVVEIQKAILADKAEDVPLLARRAVMLAARITDAYPDNSLVPVDLRNVLAYIDVKSRGIAQIRKPFIDGLLAIPGAPEQERKMMAKEVSQALYGFVMSENPSADSSSMQAPVESVSYVDAQKFASCLSLICGYEVRLPTLEEFDAALGKFDATTIAEQAWTLENSSAKIHDCGTKKPNENGYFDLFGNVGEWVMEGTEAKKSTNDRIVAGGDCQSIVEMLEKDHVQKALGNDKSRLRGFRVVVDFSKPIDLLKVKFRDEGDR